MLYKSKSANYSHSIIINGEKVLLQFVDGSYETEDEEIIAELDNHLENVLGPNQIPRFLKAEDFSKISEPEMVFVDNEKGKRIHCEINEVLKKWKE